jgi:ABC-type sulfate transport system permease component
MKACATVFLSSILVLTSARAGLQEIENQYRTAYELGVTAKHAAAVSEMDRKYAEALLKASAGGEP